MLICIEKCFAKGKNGRNRLYEEGEAWRGDAADAPHWFHDDAIKDDLNGMSVSGLRACAAKHGVRTKNKKKTVLMSAIRIARGRVAGTVDPKEIPEDAVPEDAVPEEIPEEPVTEVTENTGAMVPEDMTKVVLVEACRDAGLAVGGTKEKLLARLREAQK